ncbi:MAG: hypothetical protein ACK5ZV_14630 [bacterium]
MNGRLSSVLQTAQSHLAQGRPEAARRLLLPVVAPLLAKPACCDAQLVQAACLLREIATALGQPAQAVHWAAKAHELDPSRADLLVELGWAELEADDLAAAAQHLSVGGSLAVGDAASLTLAASGLLRLERLCDVQELLENVLQSGGADAWTPDERWGVLQRLASAQLERGRSDQAAATVEHMLQLKPDDPATRWFAATVLNYASAADPARVRLAHVQCGRRLGRARSQRAPLPEVGRRPLRVGLLSSDYRSHSCAYFLQPLLCHADRSRLHLLPLCLPGHKDAGTAWLAEAARGGGHGPLTDVPCTDPGFATAVGAAKLDVLVDVNGLSAGNVAHLLGGHLAPRLVNWLGYPNITGLPEMDARLVDDRTDPPAPCPPANGPPANRPPATDGGEPQERIDGCFVCYAPPPDLPPASPPQPPVDGPVRFGSFNSMMKLSDRTLALWSAALAACPQSTLTIKAKPLGEPTTAQGLLSRLASAGIPVARVRLLPATAGVAEHLSCYHQIDVALDTTPYAGTTTTCEALVMGVPVLTFAPHDGPHAARVGASLLHAAWGEDAPRWIATSDRQWAELAARAAAHVAGLRASRSALRYRVLASPLCDGPGFAARFADAIERIARTPVRSADHPPTLPADVRH